MWANMVGALWVKVLNLEAPKVKKNIFIDDKSLRTDLRESFQEVFRINSEFDEFCGQTLNMKKVTGFVCHPGL